MTSFPNSPSQRPSQGWSIGRAGTSGLEAWIKDIERGFDAGAAKQLRQRLGLSRETMAQVLGISARTLKRRETGGRLTPEESDRLFRLSQLFETATDLLGSEDTARVWMTSSQYALGGRVPVEMARYQPGALEVERCLGRLGHGIPL